MKTFRQAPVDVPPLLFCFRLIFLLRLIFSAKNDSLNIVARTVVKSLFLFHVLSFGFEK